MHSLGYELPRIYLLGTWVNKGKRKVQSPLLESRTARQLLKVNGTFGCDLYLVGELRGYPRKRNLPLSNSG